MVEKMKMLEDSLAKISKKVGKDLQKQYDEISDYIDGMKTEQEQLIAVYTLCTWLISGLDTEAATELSERLAEIDWDKLENEE